MVIEKFNRSELAQKFMQIGNDVKCMHTNFGGRGIFSFGDFAPFCLPSKTAKFPFQTMDYSPWGSENRISSKLSVMVFMLNVMLFCWKKLFQL